MARHLFHLAHFFLFFSFDVATKHGCLDGQNEAAGAPTGKRPLPAQHKTLFTRRKSTRVQKTSIPNPRDQKRPQGLTHTPSMALLLNGTWQPHYNLCIFFYTKTNAQGKNLKAVAGTEKLEKKSVTMSRCICLGEGSTQVAANPACKPKKKKKACANMLLASFMHPIY